MRTSLPTAKLAEVADLNPVLGQYLRDDDQVSFVPMSALDAVSGTTQDNESRCYSQVRKGYTPFMNGDLLIARITPCFENGKIAQARLRNSVGFGSTEFHVVRPHANHLDARYLLHFLRQDQIRLAGERKMTGSAGQRRVPQHFLAGLRVPLPPLPEQWRIAEILDRADALRAKRRAALARIDTLTQSIFLDMFGDLGDKSADWARVRVGDYVAEFQGGKSVKSETDKNTVARNRVLKVSAVTGMRFLPHESKPVSDNYDPPINHFVQSGDLLFSRANTTELVGAVAYVHSAPQNLLLPDKLWRFVWCKPSIVEPLFIWALFQTPTLRREIARRATGTSGSMKNITKEKVLNISTICPPIEIQKQFANLVGSIYELRHDYSASAKGFDALFTSLQQRVFQGELCIRDDL